MTTNTTTVLQQCRTMFILRTICLVVNAIILVKTLQEDVFTILKGDAVTMVCIWISLELYESMSKFGYLICEGYIAIH